jgi:hypothetical protein
MALSLPGPVRRIFQHVLRRVFRPAVRLFASVSLGLAVLLHASLSFAIDDFNPLAPEVIRPVRVATSAERGSMEWLQVNALVERVFKKAGLVFTVEFVPANRSLMYLRSGVIDVEFARFRDFDKILPESLRVDPPIFIEKFVAVSLASEIAPHNWEEATKFDLAYKSGNKTIEYYTLGLLRREAVTSSDACLGMVKLKRVQICIGTEGQFQDNATYLGDKDFHTSRIAEIPMHFFVGPHRPELPAKIGKALAELQKSGELTKAATPVK